MSRYYHQPANDNYKKKNIITGSGTIGTMNQFFSRKILRDFQVIKKIVKKSGITNKVEGGGDPDLSGSNLSSPSLRLLRHKKGLGFY